MRHKSVAEERPEIRAQWAPINKLSPDQVSCGSHLKVWWICSEGHKWQATVKNRALLGSGCPYCEHRAVLKGYNDLKTLFPKIAKTWSPKNKLKPSDVSSRSNTVDIIYHHIILSVVIIIDMFGKIFRIDLPSKVRKVGTVFKVFIRIVFGKRQSIRHFYAKKGLLLSHSFHGFSISV